MFLKTKFVIKTLARLMKMPGAGYEEFKQGMLSMSTPSSPVGRLPAHTLL